MVEGAISTNGLQSHNVSRQSDQERRGVRKARSESKRELFAVHPRHLEIKDGGVRPLPGREVQPCLASIGHTNCRAGEMKSQNHAQKVRGISFVIDDKNNRRGHGLLAS